MPTAFLNMLPRLGFTPAILLCAIFTADAVAQMPCSYSVTIVPNQDCGLWTTPANPVAINNNGVVALASSSCGNPSLGRSFLWYPGDATLTPIPLAPGSLGFHVRDLNDAGVAVGMLDMPNNLGTRAGVYNSISGQWTILDPPVAGGHSEALAISENGLVCGWRSVGPQLSPRQAFVWSATTGFSDLYLESDPPGVGVFAADVNSAGKAIVRDHIYNGSVALIWHDRSITPIALPDQAKAHPNCINDLGVCGGVAVSPDGTSQGFLWSDGVATMLGTLPTYSYGGVRAINNSNVAVGSNFRDTGATRSFVWQYDRLRDLLFLSGQPYATIASAESINDNGWILATRSQSGRGGNIVMKPIHGYEGDVNCDAVVNVTDLLEVIGNWGSCIGCAADLNGDQDVDVRDLIEVILHWGPTGEIYRDSFDF